MGKKVNWFSAIKKALTPNSKQKLSNDHQTEKKNPKKWGLGKKHGGTSFIPLYRKPSSIEKILGDAENEQRIRHAPAFSGERTPSIPGRAYQQQPEFNHNTRVFQLQQQPESNHTPTNTGKNQRITSSNERQREPSLPTRVYHQQPEVKYTTGNSTRNQRTAATKIQAAYKGYTARKNMRAVKGMIRLQGVVRGHNVKRQTLNAMKQMQLLVKVQSQIQLRRINMLENLLHQNPDKNERELESSLARWNLTQPSESDPNEEWDDSVLTIEEIEARTQRKTEALMKRERILAYASSRQWFKNAGGTQTPAMELRSGALPWWWIRIEQQIPKNAREPSKNKSTNPSPVVERSPRPQSKHSRFGAETLNSPTPPSYRLPTPTKSPRTPILSNRLPQPQSNSSTPMKQAKTKTNGNPFSFPSRDDDSFTSCPPLSVPNYMTPTISAKAKLRLHDNLNERSPVTPTPGQKRRLSFPLTQSIGSSMGWKRASSLFSSKGVSSSQTQTVQRNQRAMSVQSIGNLSVDSTTSMPAAVGRKPFNRFV